MKKWMLAALICLLAGGSAEAASSANGSTGMINTPTADTIREGQFFLGYYHLNAADTFALGVNAAPNLELSVVGRAYDHADQETQFNVKYALKEESILLPGIAVGIEDIGGQDDRTAYAVLSKALPLGFRVHAGYGNGRYDGVFYAVEKSLISMPVGGVFPETSLIVERDGHATNYGVRMSLISGLKINAGWRDHETYVGMTYNFY